MQLPMRVFAPGDRWRAYTESLDVSPLGVKFRFLSPIESGLPLRLELPMPEHLRLHKGGERIYGIQAVVCHVAPTENNEYSIGAEFGAVA